MKTIAMYGGSFNPPLNSHFIFAKEILGEFSEIEKIIFVPVNSEYSKRDLASNEDRYNMLNLICENETKLEVSKIEIGNGKAIPTIETLETLSKQHPEYDVCFIIGSDNLKELYWWARGDELLEHFKVIVLEREDDNIDEIIQNSEFLKKHEKSFIKLKKHERLNISSTIIREKINKGEDVTSFMSERVYNYIKSEGLYGYKK